MRIVTRDVAARLRVSSQQTERADIQTRDGDDMTPGVGRNAKPLSSRKAAGQEREPAGRGCQRAHAQRRNFGQGDFHQGPGDAPEQTKCHQHQFGLDVAGGAAAGFGGRLAFNRHGALDPTARYQSAIWAPVQNFTSLFLLIVSSTRRKYFSRCGAPMMYGCTTNAIMRAELAASA